MPADAKKEGWIPNADYLGIHIAAWLIAVSLGVLVFQELQSWRIALIAAWFFQRLELLISRR